jgi:hypothetical protein
MAIQGHVGWVGPREQEAARGAPAQRQARARLAAGAAGHLQTHVGASGGWEAAEPGPSQEELERLVAYALA